MRIGVFFGGSSREREVSFAGGRTVYDSLNKALFTPVPIFVDSFGNFVLIKWQYIYKGSIRDFYPPVESLPPSPHQFQVYAESLIKQDTVNKKSHELDLLKGLGRHLAAEELKEFIDFAFLALHGESGEDGRLQGLLEWLGIPYSGSGIFASSLGMDKSLQKRLISKMGFATPRFFSFARLEWNNPVKIFNEASALVGFPMVVKSSRQGSSIGVTVVKEPSLDSFTAAVESALFCRKIALSEWTETGKKAVVQELIDFRSGPGLPARYRNKIIYHPEDLYALLETSFVTEGLNSVFIEALAQEEEVLVEEFIAGREFSCIVIEDTDGQPIALPPTEVTKDTAVYDYKSKYLPGRSRKTTPIPASITLIERICKECERLFTALDFDVYARIDGFITRDERIFLNDPNTTSGMMPSSFFFHQAAEIGLSPSQFITFIIYSSLVARIKTAGNQTLTYQQLRESLALKIERLNDAPAEVRIAVITGGASSERHIALESGRNVFEKLNASGKYKPVPIYLSMKGQIRLTEIPLAMLLKDNADDLLAKLDDHSEHPAVKKIKDKARNSLSLFAKGENSKLRDISFDELAQRFDAVFIALHGRPGEDGVLQNKLDNVGLPYNGSGAASSAITIDKFITNELLAGHGLRVAKHRLVFKEDWMARLDQVTREVSKDFSFPLIAKPSDDGCSSAVMKIRDLSQLQEYLKLLFRSQQALRDVEANYLGINALEEFPMKEAVLLEELIIAEGASRFMEITGGMLTQLSSEGATDYIVFEASETLATGSVLSLEEKFLAGEGQNVTPPRYSEDKTQQQRISGLVKETFLKVARLLNVEGYCRIDAFVRIYDEKVDVIIIEVNSLPGMTPATAIFHQAALAGYQPYEFIDAILTYALRKSKASLLNE